MVKVSKASNLFWKSARKGPKVQKVVRTEEGGGGFKEGEEVGGEGLKRGLRKERSDVPPDLRLLPSPLPKEKKTKVRRGRCFREGGGFGRARPQLRPSTSSHPTHPAPASNFLTLSATALLLPASANVCQRLPAFACLNKRRPATDCHCLLLPRSGNVVEVMIT